MPQLRRVHPLELGKPSELKKAATIAESAEEILLTRSSDLKDVTDESMRLPIAPFLHGRNGGAVGLPR
jgi:hypothetical protein